MTKVLIVDDNTSKIRAATTVMLSECGLAPEDVLSATDAAQARGLLQAHLFDLLLLDIVLPADAISTPIDKTAIELLIELEQRETLNKPGRIIGFTAFEGLSEVAISSFSERAWTVIKYDENSDDWKPVLKNCVDYISSSKKVAAPAAYAYDICIITALLSPEMEAVKRLDWNWLADTPIDDSTWASKGSFSVADGSASVVAMSAPRMGLVSAALLSAKAIQNFRPRFLVMCGICAGVQKKTNIGDVLIANPSWNWQSGKHAVSELGPHFNAAPHSLPIPEFIRSRIDQINSDRQLLAAIKSEYPAPAPKMELNVRCGPVASGSAVVADADVLEPLLKLDRSMIGLEMEIYGMYAAAVDAGAPRPSAVAFKSVCDFGTKDKDDAHQAYAAHTSARVMAAFFERFLPEIRRFAGMT